MAPQQLVNAMSSHQATSRGFVTLLSVLIITLVGSALAFSTLTLTGVSNQSTLVLEQGLQAHGYADACAEISLGEIKFDASYVGSGSEDFEQGTCSYVVEDAGTDERTISATGSSGRAVRRVRIEATTETVVTELSTTTSIIDTLWSEPSDF